MLIPNIIHLTILSYILILLAISILMDKILYNDGYGQYYEFLWTK